MDVKQPFLTRNTIACVKVLYRTYQMFTDLKVGTYGYMLQKCQWREKTFKKHLSFHETSLVLRNIFYKT